MSDDKPIRREAHRWQKGQPSPNPKGRPRVGVSLAAAVRERWPADRLVELATSLAESDDDAIKLRALEFLAERGYGKVPTTIDATLTASPVLDGERILARLSTEAIREVLAADDAITLDDPGSPAAITVETTTNHRLTQPRVSDEND